MLFHIPFHINFMHDVVFYISCYYHGLRWILLGQKSPERNLCEESPSLNINIFFCFWSYSLFSSTVANCLLTSCTDNVCRIWCESIKQGDHDGPPSRPTKNHHKCMWHLSQQPKKPLTKDDTTEDPLLRYQLPSSLQFHIAAAVNALNDIPILSSLDSISSSTHSSFVLHWLNNKEIQFTMAAESCLGAPVLALEVESVDISDDSSNSDSEAELLVPSDEEYPESYKRKNKLDTTL